LRAARLSRRAISYSQAAQKRMGKKIELIQLFAEAHQAAGFPAVFQAEQVAGFVDGDFSAPFTGNLVVDVVQAMKGDDRGMPAQLGFAVHIGQDGNAQIALDNAHSKKGAVLHVTEGVYDLHGIELVARGHKGVVRVGTGGPDAGRQTDYGLEVGGQHRQGQRIDFSEWNQVQQGLVGSDVGMAAK
jgi:hypothetical protein